MTRRGLREQVFKMLFRVEFHNVEDMPEQMNMFEEVEECSEKDKEYISNKFHNIVEKIDEIDAAINEVSEGWKTRRMGKVDLTLIRLAVYEMKYEDDITFDTLLDTQFFASKINKAVELQSQVGHLKNGKLCSYDNEITSLISEIEKFSQSSTPDSDVAKQYVKQLSVGKQSDLHDCFREMIIKCVKIGISKDAIMQFINKALEIGLLDKERFTNIKEIITALLDKRNQG